MAKKQPQNVTIRVRIGESELEVTGPSDFVEKKIEEFLVKQKETLKSGSSERASQQSSEPSKKVKVGKGLSPAQFFKKINPRTDVDRMLAAGYYLEISKNYENFTALEAKQIIKEAKRIPPKNANDAINQNIKKGLVMSAGDKDGKMAFVLTSDGEEFLDEFKGQ